MYDHRTDPNEWHNLAGAAEHAAIKRELARSLPKTDAPDGLGYSRNQILFDPVKYEWKRAEDVVAGDAHESAWNVWRTPIENSRPDE